MEPNKKSYHQLVQDLNALRLQLEEANDTIDAIRTGQVDAFVVKGINGHELYTLKTADQTYRIFIEKMAEGAVTLNEAGIIVYSNSQFAKMIGLPLTKVTGTAFIAFVIPGDITSYEALFKSGWEGDIKGEISIVGTDGTIPVQLSLTTLELDEGYALSIILTDLTVQKETQLLLKLNNEQLSQLNNALELSNHDLQQFASVASHDLQEPLRKILIFSNIISERFSGELSEEATTYFQKIISSSQRMRALIIDILDYSRLSAQDNRFELTDLNLLTGELLEDYEFVIKETGAQIIVESLPSITVNPGQIRQVFQNMISNALKFVKRGRVPAIVISSKFLSGTSFDSPEEKDGPFCSISFKDNGIGFDEKYAASIFTLFRRLHTKDKFEGAGIGLAISKKIIEKHKGMIMATGKDGIGAEFNIILPVSQNAQ